MRTRPFVACLVAACLATAGLVPAAAAGVPSCRLLVDPPGDVTDRSNPANVAALDEPAADLVSADVASDRGVLTVVVRPRAFRPAATTELYHQVFLWVGRAPYRFDYLHDLSGTAYTAYHIRSEDVYSDDAVDLVPGATGTEDTARGEIRMSIGLNALAPYGTVAPGTVVRGLAVWTHRSVAMLTAHVVDEGRTSRTYRLGEPSCVPVGR